MPQAIRPASTAGETPIAPRLLAWYDRHARRLPWRIGPKDRARGVVPDPYRVWLSEVMLQQTTVAAVKSYFEAFTAAWPTVARPRRRTPRRRDEGLGRARLLRPRPQPARLRRRSSRDHGGRFPETAAVSAPFPASASTPPRRSRRSPSTNRPPVVDGNVERVIARLFAIDTPLPEAKKIIRGIQSTA